MANIKITKFVKKALVTVFDGVGFTNGDIVDHIARALVDGASIRNKNGAFPTKTGDVLIFNMRSAFRDKVNKVLNSQRDGKSLRLYIHSIVPHRNPVWKHRDIASLEELERFSAYLRKQGKRLIKEAAKLDDYIAKRRRREGERFTDVVRVPRVRLPNLNEYHGRMH